VSSAPASQLPLGSGVGTGLESRGTAVQQLQNNSSTVVEEPLISNSASERLIPGTSARGVPGRTLARMDMESTEETRAAERQARRQARKLVRRQAVDEMQVRVTAMQATSDKNAHALIQQGLATTVQPVGAIKATKSQGARTTAMPTVPTALTVPGVPTAPTAPTAVMGRPSEYTQNEADRICAWIAEGRSLKSYCRLEGRSMETVYRWLREQRDFRERYARAHDDRADSLADEIVDIADDAALGTMEQIQAARLRVDARKWVASKLKPLRWGEYQPVVAKTNITFNLGIRPGPAALTLDAELPLLSPVADDKS